MIWFDKNLTIDSLAGFGANTMGEALGMKYEAVGPDFLKMSMPVTNKTRQPMGLLHGGASAALAETIGSVAGFLCVDPEKYACVGLELNCNHVRGKKDGTVFATAMPLHLGKTTQVWDIKINDEREKLVCVARLTLAVIHITQ